MINLSEAISFLGEPEGYYLLTDFLPEDRVLRERLKEDRIVSFQRAGFLEPKP